MERFTLPFTDAELYLAPRWGVGGVFVALISLALVLWLYRYELRLVSRRAAFGLLALRLDRIFKFIGLGLVGLTMLGLILWVEQRLRQRGLPIRPEGPPPELTPGGGEKMSTDNMACNGQSDAPDVGNKVHATVTPPLTGS